MKISALHLLIQTSLAATILCIAGCDNPPSASTPKNSSAEASAEREQSDATKKLQSLGYLAAYRTTTEAAGTRVLLPELVAPGYTLISSGHLPTALLLNVKGETVHSWFAPIEKLFPSYVARPGIAEGRTKYWRYVQLLPQGELLVIFEGIGIAKLDRDSQVLWTVQNSAHHEVDVQPDGSLAVLTRDEKTHQGQVYLDDHVDFLNADGSLRDRISLLDAVVNSPFGKKILRGRSRYSFDVLHSNSLQVLPAGIALPDGVVAGDVLVSARNRSYLFIVSRATKQVVWAMRDRFRAQHTVTVTAAGELVLFDNLGKKKSRSRVLVYRFPSFELLRKVEKYDDSGTFYSKFMGEAWLLPNGNLLVVESEGGKVIEITPDDRRAWEFVSPYRQPETNLINIVSHAERIPVAEVDGWLGAQ